MVEKLCGETGVRAGDSGKGGLFSLLVSGGVAVVGSDDLSWCGDRDFGDDLLDDFFDRIVTADLVIALCLQGWPKTYVRSFI